MKKKNQKFTTFMIFLLLTNGIVAWGEPNYELIKSINIPDSDDTSFGCSISTNEQYIIVGAKEMTVDETTQAGQVFLYDYNGELKHTLSSDKPQQDYKFGTNVQTGYDNILVSEMLYSYRFKGLGTVYLYKKDGVLLQKITSPGPEDRFYFGLSTVILKENLLVSEPKADTESEKWAGKVHMYDKSGTLVHSQVSPEPKTTGNFGYRVVADEDIIVVSELVGNIEMQEFKAGTVYIFDKEFSLQTTLTPPNSEELNYFGYSLALNEGFIFVGDRQATASGQERAGIIYVYDRLGAFQYTLEADAPSKGAYFGESIAVKKDLLIIGEPYFDHETVDTGKIYIYKESNGNYVLEDEIVPSEPTAKGMFGKTVSVSDEKIIVGQLGMEKVYIYSLLEILPPEFNYANLNVPDEVSKNNAAIITINCTNSGSISGSTTICMSIDGEMVDEKMVSIDAGQTKTVIFTYSTGEVGVHKVEIEGLDTEYEVKKGIPGFPINSITTGLLITIFLINILARKD